MRRKYCLVGIPDHQGILNVGGRIGASRGPREFRRVFHRFRGTDGVLESKAVDLDLNPLPRDLSQCHRAAANLVRDQHQITGLSVVVGGGHDHGFSQILGVTEALQGRSVGCINIDAHLDVRKPAPIISSGSPFYLAIEAGVLDPSRFIEFGIQAHCNGQELWDYIGAKKVEVVPYRELRRGRAVMAFKDALDRLAQKCDAIVVSLDLDAMAQAFAPGVSAPQAEGFSSGECIEMMELAGQEAKVCSLGIFELNPEHDIDDRTTILAATSAYHFLMHAIAR
jgi:formimidoylglutamase